MLGLKHLHLVGHTTTIDVSYEQPYGLHNVGLGPSSAGSIVLAKRTLVGIVSQDFFVALFGLSNTAIQTGSRP